MLVLEGGVFLKGLGYKDVVFMMELMFLGEKVFDFGFFIFLKFEKVMFMFKVFSW